METYPHLPKLPKSEGDWFVALMDLARYLRTPGGCPWDRQQTGRDFAKFLREETEELMDAFATNDNDDVAEEFGDCLFTLLASAAAAEEEGRFKMTDALRATHEKMIRRHEHVFGDTKAETPEGAIDSWNRIKAEEKKKKGKK
ncbi:MAG: nucleotide pyrophosphohydrolase [Candidatus Hydrogenedentes bacterium]|nr:nucleotide pyrophosphohydrolase [Candidatus Hydrogenedentota bacterium]MBI3119832.1 nucleotide pyrophosphohydrolase [Candidatus Hydrogenedentota bacterium]